MHEGDHEPGAGTQGKMKGFGVYDIAFCLPEAERSHWQGVADC